MSAREMMMGMAHHNPGLPLSLSTPSRVLSLDVLRGITIALMILVNDPGDWGHVFPQLDHAPWNEWTLTDLVFPTFLFLVGASMFLSLEAREAKGDCKKTLAGHIVVRSAKIFLLDLVLAYFPRMHWTTLRFYGVLTRIALCALIAGLVLLSTRKARTLVIVIVVLLAGYWTLLRWVPVLGGGLPVRDISFLDQNLNLTAVVDRALVGWTQKWLHTGALYNKTRDPEGLLSTLPAVATTLLGALASMWMKGAMRSGWNATRMRSILAAAGVAAFAAGELWSRWFPINKNLWTSSYVLLSAGLAALVLAVCSWLVDERPHPWPRTFKVLIEPWLVFGSNAIVAFTVSVVLVKTMLYFHVADAAGDRHTLWALAYRDVFARHGSNEWTSLAFALSFVAVCFLPNYVLWRRKVFFRL